MLTMKSGLPSQRLITLAEAKAQLRIEDVWEDVTIYNMIDAASLRLDGPDSVTGLPIIRRDHTATCRLSRRVDLRVGPNPTLVAVDVLVNGTWQALNVGNWKLRNVRADSAELELTASEELPVAEHDDENLRITVKAGFVDTPADPRCAPVKQACLLLTAHYFENRSATAFGSGFAELPMGVKALITPYCRRFE
jgi:uncharacterized phiE125 gp8 family phage protein